MAIKYLSNINLANNQLENFKVDNVTSDPTGLAGEGQLIYRTDTDQLKYHTGSNTWVVVGSGSGSGTVTSVALTETGTALTITGSPITGAGTLNIAGAGTSSQVVLGDLTLGTYTTGTMSSFTLAGDTGSNQTIADGNTLTVAGGTFIATVGAATDTVTADLSATGTASATTFLRGDNAWATPAGSYTSWTLGADTGTDDEIIDGDDVDIAGGTAISTAIATVGTKSTVTITNTGVTSIVAGTNVTISGATGAVTINADTQGDITAVAASTDNDQLGIEVVSGTGPIPEVGLNIIGQTNLAATAAGDDELIIYDLSTTTNKSITVSNLVAAAPQGSMSSFIVAGTTGANQTITNGNTLTLTAGTGITTVGSATDVVTITNTGVTSAVASTGIGVSGATGAVTFTNTGVTSAVAGSNISVSSATGAVTIAYTGGTGTMSSWTLAGDSGSSQTISDGNTVSIIGIVAGAAAAGIQTQANATDELELELKLSNLATVTTIDPAADFLVGVDGSSNEKILYDNVHLDQWGDAEADVDFGNNKLLDVKTGTAGTDGVNLAQVQGLVAGTGIFQGGYNAVTNSPALTGGSNVAMDTGDFYAVTTSNNTSFLGTVVEVGDLIFANNDIAASSTPAAGDYTIVQSGQSIAAAGATDGATVKGVSGFDSGNFGATASGWVTLNTSGVTAAAYGSASETLTATVDAQGLVTAMADTAISITASQVTDFCTAVETCADSNLTYAANIGDASAVTYTVNHALGTRDVIVQIYDTATYDTIKADTVRTDTANVTITTVTALGLNAARVLVSKCA